MTLNWTQLKAAGRHAASYIAGGVTVLVGWHFLSPAQGTDITTNIGLISDGLTKFMAGVAGLITTLTPIYMAWRAARAASPSEQVKSVITQLSAPEITQAANAVADPTSRIKLISAVAEMPEVKSIKADPVVAANTESPKVVR